MPSRIKCLNCGSVIDSDQFATVREESGEVMSCCPYCYDNIWEEVSKCDVCGKEDSDDVVRDGICIECLKNAVTYDTALAYIKARDYIVEFILCDWFGAEGVVSQSVDLALFCEETFRRLVANEKLLGGDKMLKLCREFCLPNYPKYTYDEEMFASWLRDEKGMVRK